MQGKPLVSVITVTYNCASSIEATIRSVIGKPGDFEYILVDGGSTDGTKEIIERYKSHLACYISEPDKGVYDAINKGVAASKGVFLYVINAGDRLLKMPYDELSSAERQQADVVMFPVQLSNNTTFKSSANWWLKLHNTIHHQGAFYARALNVKYDTGYRVFADFDLNLQLYRQAKKFVEGTTVVAFHSLDGLSHNSKYFNEVYDIIQSQLGPAYRLMSFIYFKIKGIVHRLSPKSQAS